MPTESILDQIVSYKKQEVKERKATCPYSILECRIDKQAPVRNFARRLDAVAETQPAIIAEIKRGSPSLGCIRKDLDVQDQAVQYEEGGAAGLSVLTDEHFFFSKTEDFCEIRDQVNLPMLRKEFILDEYQILESRAMGADCILLIMSILSDDQARTLRTLAHDLGMDVLAEAHTADEVKRIQDNVNSDLIGINNRNLKTFATSIETVVGLSKLVKDPAKLVAESGLNSQEAIHYLWERGIRKYLIGEALIKSQSPRDTLQEFIHL